jgi:DNA-binding response OmpR family regulator
MTAGALLALVSAMKLRRLIDRVFQVDSQPQILCADDDPNVRALCTAALRLAGYAVDQAVDGHEAREKVEHNRYAAVLLDLAMPYLHGVTLVSLLRREHSDVLQRAIVVTGVADAALTEIEPLVASVVRKPLTIEALLGAVNECCSRDETIVARREAGAVSGSSSATR